MMRLAAPAASAALPLALAVVATMLLDWPPGDARARAGHARRHHDALIHPCGLMPAPAPGAMRLPRRHAAPP